MVKEVSKHLEGKSVEESYEVMKTLMKIKQESGLGAEQSESIPVTKLKGMHAQTSLSKPITLDSPSYEHTTSSNDDQVIDHHYNLPKS